MNADQEKLYQHVEFLTTLRPFRNYKNLDSLEKVCVYLHKQFSEYGLSPSDQPYMADGTEYKNVIATYQPDKPKRMIVGAHYDVCGDQPGADDNGSAIAGLLESARMVAEASPEIDYRIDFVAFCLEEPPYFASDLMGSYIHAKSVEQDRGNIIGLINFEMIGYFHDGKQDYPFPWLVEHYPEQANFIAVVGKHEYHEFNQKVYDLMRDDADIDVQMIDDPMIEALASMSDQRSYWRLDIPALMINDTSFIRNPNYHQMSDDIDTLNFDRMAAAVSATYKAIVGF